MACKFPKNEFQQGRLIAPETLAYLRNFMIIVGPVFKIQNICIQGLPIQVIIILVLQWDYID